MADANCNGNVVAALRFRQFLFFFWYIYIEGMLEYGGVVVMKELWF